jgi:hypothetical protein
VYVADVNMHKMTGRNMHFTYWKLQYLAHRIRVEGETVRWRFGVVDVELGACGNQLSIDSRVAIDYLRAVIATQMPMQMQRPQALHSIGVTPFAETLPHTCLDAPVLAQNARP